ncbi:hypothetical protein [Gemmobacter sp. 24YEA27]|uniref:hypothetical protein n=1 Tax=Gemmobacter sp. 24YEA27 TaxID=3040672 RepID=UPI0024B336A4|nr:hypothetical protein [Gemmobacter sp. 24YEA27]
MVAMRSARATARLPEPAGDPVVCGGPELDGVPEANFGFHPLRLAKGALILVLG